MDYSNFKNTAKLKPLVDEVNKLWNELSSDEHINSITTEQFNKEFKFYCKVELETAFKILDAYYQDTKEFNSKENVMSFLDSEHPFLHFRFIKPINEILFK